MKYFGKAAVVVAVMMAASLLPSVQAKADVASDQSVLGVDMYYQWAVATDVRAPETVVLYRNDGAGWNEITTISPPASIPGFGATVAVGRGATRDQPVIVVGAPDSDQAFLYGWDGFTITPVAALAGDPGSSFGASVDISSGRVLVGAPAANAGQGTSVLFDNTGSFIAELTEVAADADAAIGTVVQLERDRAWVSAPGQEGGVGVVFEFDATNTISATIKPDFPVPGMFFGTMLSADPARVLVGGAASEIAWLQQGVNQTQITNPAGGQIVDIALEGNLMAIVDADRTISVLSDNGSTGTWSSETSYLPTAITPQQVVLGGGHLLGTGIDEGLGGGTDPLPVREFVDDGDVQKILPSIGWQDTQFGNRLDIDGETMASVRGTGTNKAQIVVSKLVGGDWVTAQLLDVESSPSGGVVIEGNTMAVALGDNGNPANPHVVVYERFDAASDFAVVGSFRTLTGTAPRGISIDESGQHLAIGLPNPGQVELRTGGPVAWPGATPQVLSPNDSFGTGATSFGWDLDFGENYLLIGKPGSTSLNTPALFAGMAEQWLIDGAGTATYFGDRVPTNSAPGDFGGWAVEIEQDLSAVASPGLGTVQVYRSGTTDGVVADPTPLAGSNWGYAMDLDAGVLVASDWFGDTVAYDLYAPSTGVVLDTFQSADAEQSDFAFQTFPVATSEGIIMTGARLEDWQGRDAGAIYTFTVTPSDPPVLGRVWLPVVDIDGKYAVVGNPAEDLVHMLRNDGAGWTEYQQLIGVAGTGFGAAVSIEGDRLAVGAPDANTNVGEVQIFARQVDETYAPNRTLTFAGADADDRFGSVLDLVGDFVIVGSPVDTGTASAVVFDHRTGATEQSWAAVDEGYASTIALSYLGDDAAVPYMAYIGAPDDPGNLGFVAYKTFDGVSWNDGGTLVPSGVVSSPGWGSSVEASGTRVAIATVSEFEVEVWEFDPATGSPLFNNVEVLPISEPVGQVALSGDVLAVGSPTSSDIHLWSDNGSDLSFQQTVVLESSATGRSLAIDGQWLIGATDAASTDWVELANITDLTVVAAHPNEPANKTTPEFASDDLGWGSALAISDDTIIAAAEGNRDGSAVSELVVIDRASDTIVQRLRNVVLGSDSAYTSIDLDGDRLAFVKGESVQIVERAGAGAPFTTTVLSVGANAVTDIDLNGDVLAFGIANQNQVRVYDFVGGAWQPANGSPLTAAFTGPGDELGFSVAVAGDVVVAGVPNDFSGLPGTSVAVWARPDSGSAFVEQSRVRYDDSSPGQIDRFGYSVAFDGNRLVVGAPFQDFNGGGGDGFGTGFQLGTVQVLDHLGDGSFGSVTTLRPDVDLPSGDSNSLWGTSVDLAGDLIVAGGPGYSGTAADQGAVIVYRFDAAAGGWSVEPLLSGTNVAADAEPGDALGTVVAIADPAIVASAPGEDASGDDAGALYEFAVDFVVVPPRIWPTTVEMDNGWSAIGNPEFDTVYIVRNTGSGWNLIQEITGTAGSSFGAGLALEGDELFIGAPDANDRLGEIFRYVKNGGGTFTLDAAATRATSTANDEFGSVLDTAGDWVIAGAPVPGGVGAAVMFDNELLDVPIALSSGVAGDDFGSAVLTASIFEGSVQNYAWVGAPADNASTGRVYGFYWNGTDWASIGGSADVGEAAGDGYGTALEATGRVLAATAPGAPFTRLRQWSAGGPLAGITTIGRGLTGSGLDVVFNGDLVAVSSSDRVDVFSDNGSRARYLDFQILSPNAALFSGSVDADGEWFISATDASSIDWTEIALIEPISTHPRQPASGTVKIVPEFGTDRGNFGQVVDSTDDVFVVVSSADTVVGAPARIDVFETATGLLTQSISDTTITAEAASDIAVDGDWIAVVRPDRIELLQRSGPGTLYDVAGSGPAITDVSSIDLDGTLLIAGQESLDQVRIWEFDGANWNELAESPLTGAATIAGDDLGTEVAVSGNIILAGADIGGDRPDAGYAISWSRADAASAFAEQSTLIGSGGIDLDAFGNAIDFDGTHAVIGAALEDGAAVDSGAVYVFEHLGGGAFDAGLRLDPVDPVDPAGAADARYGTSVAVSDGQIVAGGPGVSGNDTRTGAIATWTFDPVAGVWAASSFVEGSGESSDGDLNDALGSSITISGTTVAAGAPNEDSSGQNAGAVYLFTLDTTPVSEPDGKLVSEPGSDVADGEVGDLFGSAIDTDGARLVIGAPEAGDYPAPVGNVGSDGSGGVYVYTRNAADDGWDFEQFVENPDTSFEAPASEFGAAVAVDGDRLVVGAPATGSTSTGTAWVIDLTGAVAPSEILAASVIGSARYGLSVAIEGDMVVVGSPQLDFDPAGNPVPSSNYGGFHVWQEAAGSWANVSSFSGDILNGQYGRSVDLDGGNVAVGSLDNSGLGVVEVWRPDGAGDFVADPRLVGPEGGGQFGFDLDLSGDLLVVGAPNAETATVFTYDGAAWDAGIDLAPSSADPGDEFGQSVAIEGTVIAVGEPADTTDAEAQGRIHVFGNTGVGEWTVLNEFVAADPGVIDWLGRSVELFNGEVIAGAPFDDNTNGIDGGAVYFFDVVPPEPPIENKLIAEIGSDPTDGEDNDLFGGSATDGQRLVISAPEKDAATGGVHVYTRNAADDGWDFERYIENPDASAGGSRFGIAADVEGDLLVVGAPFASNGADANAGTVWLFDLSTDPMTVTELPAPVSRANHFYGISLDLDGDVLAIGARGDADDGAGGTATFAGELHVFERDGAGTWNNTLIRSGDAELAQYTATVSVDGDRMAVGALGVGNTGYVEVLERAGVDSPWLVTQTFTGDAVGDQFGFGMDLDGNNLAIAAPGVPSVTMFTYHEGAWDGGVEFSNLGEVENITSIDIDGTVVIVGDQFFDNPDDEGRAVVYGNTDWLVWSELAVLDNPDPATNDFFGADVTAYGDGQLIVGAPNDDNRNGTDAGAAYLFSVTPPVPPTPPVDPTIITEVTYDLPTSVMPGATSVTIEGASVASTSDGATSGGGIVAASIGAIDFAAPETADFLGDLTLFELGIDLASVQGLLSVPLSEIPIDGGWESRLPAEYVGVPLQAITLGDLYNSPNIAPESIPLRFIDVQESPLRFIDIAAIAYGQVELLSIDLDGDPATSSFDEWCQVFADQGTSCADLGVDAASDVTLGTIAATGVNLEATPLRFIPLRFIDIEASPLRFIPLRFIDIEASPLRFIPLRFIDIEASPLRFIPLRFIPLRFIPLRFIDLQSTPLRFIDIEATPLRFIPLRFIGDLPAVVDCSLVDCSSDTLSLEDAAAAGALRDGFDLADLGSVALGDLNLEDLLPGLDEASADALLALVAVQTIEDLVNDAGSDFGELTLGDLDPQAYDDVAELANYFIGDFLSTVDPEVLAGYTLNDFLLLFVPREAYEWDAVDLGSVNLQLAGMAAPLTASVSFTTDDGPAVDDVTLLIDLPDGAVAQASTFVMAATGARVADVFVTDTTATVEISDVASGVPQTLTFGLYQGLDLGSSTSVVTASTDTSTALASDTITVVEAFEPENDGLGGAVPVLSDNLYVSHLGTSGDADFFRLTVTEPATTVSVQLANLAADFDLVVYGPKLGSILPTDDGAVAGAPTIDFDASGSGSPLSPTPLNDLPNSLEELQVYGASYFRGTDAEQVDFLAIEAGDFFVQVTGYLGASSPEPYSLRAATTPTVELECPSRTFAFAGATPGTNTSAGGADTLVLMNRSRFESLYGAAETTSMLTAVDNMVNAAAANGINATVLDLDAFASVQGAYDAWDATPCSAIAVNNVVTAISNEILGIRSVQSLDNLLIIGGDDVVPFARVKDGTTIANEQSYTNTFTAAENNALRSAFSGSWVLTDDPYADQAATAIANTDRVVYVPEVAMGRLVETPGEIIGALEHYVTFNGSLDPQTGFVAGYDFLDDGAELTGDNLEAVTSPGAVQRLINETWTAAELEAGLSTNPDTALVAAHFDHANALPAASSAAGVTTDLFDVTQAENLDFTGSIMFSVGCHGGLSVSDLLIAPTGVVSQDWAQTFLGGGAAAFVGNTGYGYGDDTAVALSEKLMADFAAGLGDYETVGEALLYAKQSYAADLTVYGAYDEKALMEATLYGIPFYTLGNVVVPEPVADPPTAPAPTGGEAYTDTFDPVLEVTGDGTEDEVWSTPGDDGEDQVQVTNGYPILPRYEWEVTQQDPGNDQQLELEARGVVLESLVTRDEINVDPATARAVYDLAANEPNIDSPDVTFALSPAISTYLTPEGIRQDVNMTVGAFQSSAADGSGTMRLFEEFEATVYYADNPSAEATKPIVTGVQANPAGGAFNLAVTVQDESPIVRVMALVTPTPSPNVLTPWQLLELSDAGGGTWQGDIALPGENIQWLVMAVDTHGNTAWSMSKQLAFDGEGGGDYPPVLTAPVAPADPTLVGDAVSLSADLWDFDGSDDPISVTWDFGDGSGCTPGAGGTCELEAPTDSDPFGSTSATHVYDAPGAYTVTVTATDSTGQSDTIVLGPVVVTTESTQGSVTANGRVRVTNRSGDSLPDGVLGKRLKINVTSGYTEEAIEDFNVRFTVGGFDFRGDGFDYVDVIGQTALVSGTGTINREGPEPQPVVYTVFVDDSTNTVVLTLWEAGADPDTTTPLYRITSRLGKKTAVKVRG